MKKTAFNNDKTTSATTENVINNNWFKRKIFSITVKNALAAIFVIMILLPLTMQGQITFSKEDAACGAADGKATVTVNGGTAPYTYAWSNGGTTATITNLSVGNYSVNITDANGCTGTGNVFIDNKTDLQVDISGGNVTTTYCSNQQAPSITLTASMSGGKAPFVCSWPSHSLVVNSSGGYTVTVTDANQCIKSASTYVLFIPVECSSDPNDITGTDGYGQQKMVGSSDKLPYTIRYENNPDFATVPAQKVTIDLPFDTAANMLSLRLGNFGFGSFIFSVPQNSTFYSKRLDVADSLGVYVDITAGIDVQNKKAFWIFESIDPNTGLAPNNANRGYLLVNDSITHKGEGFVSFTMLPKSTVHTGDSITAQATIVFDINDPIKTNKWKNIIDAHYPTSHVNPLPAITDTNFITISFTASDDIGGSGVKQVKLFMAKNTGTYELVGTYNKDSVIKVIGAEDDVYKFISIAEDNVGNVEPMKDNPDTYTYLGYPRIIAGNVKYHNTANTSMKNVLVYLRNSVGAVMDSMLCDQSGGFDFGYKSKMTYLMDGSTDAAWGGVNSTDALIIRRNIIGLSVFDYFQTKAADLDNSGNISGVDALLLRKRIVGDINSFTIRDWTFNLDTVKVEKQNIFHTLFTLCAGDVNGSYTPILTKSSNISLSQKGEINADRNQLIELPVYSKEKMQVAAVTLMMDFPFELLNIENLVSPFPGLLYSAKNGKLILAWDSLSPIAVEKGEALFVMKARINREATEKDRIIFTLGNQSEFADKNADIIDGVSLSIPNINISRFLDYELSPNFPNPFSKSTEIRYELPEDGFVRLKAYNILGQEVRTMVMAHQKAGSYSIHFDGSDLTGGTYSYKIEVEGKTRKYTASHIMIIVPTN